MYYIYIFISLLVCNALAAEYRLGLVEPLDSGMPCVMYVTTAGNRNAVELGHPAGYCFVVAVDLLNNNTITAVPDSYSYLTELYGTDVLVGLIRDTTSDRKKALFATLDLINNHGVVGIVGESNSFISGTYLCAVLC